MFSIKKNILIIYLFSAVAMISAQVPPDYRFLKTWKITDKFATVDSIRVDSVPLNYQNSNSIDRYSISNSFNGNLGSPIQSKLYFDRPNNNPDFIFADAYYPYLMNVEHATFYNTKTPYSNLDYNTGGSLHRDEDHIKFLFTANPKKNFNFGTTLDYIYSPGEYTNQAVQRFSGSIFGSYQGKYYSATALLATNDLSNYENGGISKSTDITAPISGVLAVDIPVNITGYSNLKQTQFFYNQQYSIGFERKIKVSADSVRLEFVPVTRFAHTLKIDDLRKRYFENSTEKNFYKNTYLPFSQTNDTSAVQTLSNTFSVSMAEEFNKWMNFGLTAYLENEIQNYSFKTDSLINSTFNSSTKVGGILSKQRGKTFRYNVLGELCFIGLKAGDFKLDANLGGYFKIWNDSISLVVNGFIRSDKPSFFMQNYQSNHFRWQNDFSSVYRTHLGGTFSVPTRSFALNVSVENLTNFIYFDSRALPSQFSGNIQVLAANLKLNFHVGRFALENNAVYQLSSQPTIMALPNLVLYHNLYYNDLWFKVLTVQLGVNVRYHSSYYAPGYMPAIGQFYNQSTTLIGNYPMMNAYLNMHLKRTRFFIEYYHVNQMFMKGAYFSMPNYPIDPANIKLGISWNFYD